MMHRTIAAASCSKLLLSQVTVWPATHSCVYGQQRACKLLAGQSGMCAQRPFALYPWLWRVAGVYVMLWWYVGCK
jgi:hypothetical protein